MTYSVPGLVRTHLVSSSYMGSADSPFVRTRAVIDQMKGWEIMKAVTSGTEYLRENCETFLPLEPREDYTAYLARVNRAVFTPYTQRLIRAATGLILRKPISVTGDPYWTEVFNKDVDGCGSDLDEYARRLVTCALTYGHSHVLVDFPAPSNARSLAEERALNRRPYWIEVDPTNVYGWRLDREANYGSLTQVALAKKQLLLMESSGKKFMTKYVSSSQVVIASFVRKSKNSKCKGHFHTPLRSINPTLRRSTSWLNLAISHLVRFRW